MNPKIKLRRSTNAVGKKIDAGEPMFDLTSGKLYISKADNKTIGTDAEVVEIGNSGGSEIPDNIECVSVTTTPSGSGSKSGKIVLNDAFDTSTITLDGNTGNISAKNISANGGDVTVSMSGVNGGHLNAGWVSAEFQVQSPASYSNNLYSNPTGGTIQVRDDITIDSDETLRADNIYSTTANNQIKLGRAIVELADTTSAGLEVKYGSYGDTKIKAGSIETGSISTSGAIASGGQINANGGVSIPSGKSLTNNGSSSFNGVSSFNGITSFGNTTTFTGTTNLNGTTNFNGGLNVNSLSTTGDVTVNGKVTASGGFFSNGQITPLLSTTMPTDFNNVKTGPKIYVGYVGMGTVQNAPSDAGFAILEVFSQGSYTFQRYTVSTSTTSKVWHRLAMTTGAVTSWGNWIVIHE